ncbi:MAG TPA: tetratricopeptide repeat protein [Pseudonocardiaceae bacterium]|nr:tetratricopeptide repeat protein [Pseudonocardiaceae bacterium]
MAAERIAVRPHLQVGELVENLSEERNRLDLLATQDDELSAVRAVFSWSYQALDPQLARVFRNLGLHPTPKFSLAAVAALTDATTSETRTVLVALSSMNLLEETGRNRYRLHDLLHVYARERVTIEESDSERARAVRRLIGWYLLTADSAARQIGPPRAQERVSLSSVAGTPSLFATRNAALTWCDTECANLVSIARQALEQGEPVAAWQIPVVLWTYFHLRKPWGSWFEALTLGLEAAREVNDRAAETWVHNDLAAACMDLRRFDEALAHLDQVRLLRQGLDVDPWTDAWTITTRGFVHQASGDWTNAWRYHQHAYDLYERIGEEFGKGLAAACLGEIAHQLGKVERSVELLKEAQNLFRGLQEPRAEGFVLDNLALALVGAGRTDEALELLEYALALKRQSGSERGEATTLDQRGRLLAQIGRVDEAVDAWRDALIIIEDLGDRQAHDVRDRIDRVSSLGNRSTLVE